MKNNDYLSLYKISTPIGAMTCLSDNQNLYLLMFEDDLDTNIKIEELFFSLNKQIINSDSRVSLLVVKEINDYFKGTLKNFSVRFKFYPHQIGFSIGPGQYVYDFVHATDFQKIAHKVLTQVPYGSTISYKEQAIKMNMPLSYRAAANANGLNKLGIIIPCHRVIGANKTLGGYKWGKERKEFLINHEAKFA